MPQPGFWIAESIKDKKFEDKYDLGRELGRLVCYDLMFIQLKFSYA